MTIKASSLLAVTAIWAATIAGVALEPDAWWALIFAALATPVVGIGFWRRLGLSRLIAIAGIWAGAAIMFGSDAHHAWTSVFAFLATAPVTYSPMRRDALVLGLGVALPWIFAGIVVASTGEGAWIAVFTFLTAATVPATRGNWEKGVAAILWWGVACGIMLATDGWYWLAVIAWLLTTISLGPRDFRWPRGIEWDLWDRDDDAEVIR